MSDTLTMTDHAEDLVVRDKYTGEEIATLSQFAVEQTMAAISDAEAATATAAALPRHRRAAILDGAAVSVQARNTGAGGQPGWVSVRSRHVESSRESCPVPVCARSRPV